MHGNSGCKSIPAAIAAVVAAVVAAAVAAVVAAVAVVVVAAGAAPGFVGTKTAVASVQPSTVFRFKKTKESNKLYA